MNLTKTNWPGGWNPSSDAINGSPDALLRMDNLQQEQDGAIGLIRDYKNVGPPFEDVITDIYTKSFGGIDYLWLGLNNGRAVKEIKIDGSQRFSGNILENGGTRPVLGETFDYLLALSGNQRKKFDGSRVFQLGLETPTKKITSDATDPNRSFIVNAQATYLTPSATGGTWELEEGHNLTDTGADKVQWNPDSTTLRGVIRDDFPTPYDALNIGAQQSTDPGQDRFFISIRLQDSSAFTTVRVELILDTDNLNYYWFEWPVDTSTQFNLGIDQWSTLSTNRSLFNRQGEDLTLDWKTIKAIRVIVTAVSDTNCEIAGPKFVGGIEGQLYGSYQYIYRYCLNMGPYVAKGAWSPVSDTFTVVNGSVFVFIPAPADTSPGSGLQFGFCELARRSVPSTESYYNPLTNEFSLLPDLLDQFYVVARTPDVGGDYFQDTLSDDDALIENEPANQFLQSVQDIPEPITGVIGIYNERTIYISASSIYLSDRLNPDAIDTRYTIKVTGAAIDVNLWIEKISNNLILLGTTQDLYEISGTLLDLPDGTLDIFVRSVGEAFPPISSDHTNVDGLVFYVAADGIRTSSGSNSSLLSPNLSQLFQGIDCHGIPAIEIISGGVQRYPIAVGNNKLYISIQHTDGKRRLHVYDLLRKTWSLRTTEVTALSNTQSDNVVYGMGAQLVFTDYGSSFTNLTPLPFNLLTVYDSNGQPRNRKDTFTLKLVLDTGGVPISIYLGKDGASLAYVKDITSNGISTVYINIKNYTLGFRYALQIIGSALYKFKLLEYTIEYDARPEQLNYIRIPNSNLGSTSRKRFIRYPLVLDCLNSTVRFTPIIDNVAQTAYTDFTSIGQKETHHHFFLVNIIGTDIGGILESLDGGPFELTGPDFGKAISEEMPASAEYLLVIPNNYGSPNRKRSTSIKFELNTRGSNVTFTPIVDGVSYAPATHNSGSDTKKTFEYFFATSLGDFTWIDLGGSFLSSSPFELYGNLIPQQVEQFPPRLESLYIAETNFGAPARKRVRTLPIVINTNGHDVTFLPIVDGSNDTPTIFNTTKKKTVFHYFKTDSFGVDYAGFLSGTNPFEFHEMSAPVGVEVLPVGKKYDQLGPLRFDKVGKLLALRIRLILVGNTTSIPFKLLGEAQEAVPTYDATVLYEDAFSIVPGVDDVYEVKLPKSINGTIFRVVLGPTDDPFHRYDLQARVQFSGMETDAKWVPFK